MMESFSWGYCAFMNDTTITLFSAFADGPVPEWLHLCPAGKFSGSDGRGPFSLTDAHAVITASMARGKIPLDECHSTDLAAPKGQPAPARGWIVEMQAREDGIWGKVEWTGSGRAIMEDKAYQGLSPVVASKRTDGQVLRILRASLTNDPNLPLKTIHSKTQGNNTMDLMQRLRQTLGLADDATEDAVITAITEQNTAHAAELARIAEVAGYTADKPTTDDVVKHLQARGAETGDVAGMRETIITLQSQVQTMTGDRARERATAYVDGAITAGKPVKFLRDHYIERHMADPAAVEKEIGAMVSLHAGGLKQPQDPASPSGSLTASDLEVCSLMGIDPKAYAETLKSEQKDVL